MSKSQGAFVWYDLMTSDAKAAAKFYNKVIGWINIPFGEDGHYTLLMNGEDKVGGLMAMPEEMKAHAGPHWQGFIGVDNVDAVAERIKKAGGKICKEPEDIPNVVRFAVAIDPYGAKFMLFKGAEGRPAVETYPCMPAKPGYVGWQELHSQDGTAAYKFYSELFGWTKDKAMDMGEMGIYQTFTTDDKQGGGMMTKSKACEKMPFTWLFYFNVYGIEAAMKRVKDNGGTVLMGPHQVPTSQ